MAVAEEKSAADVAEKEQEKPEDKKVDAEGTSEAKENGDEADEAACPASDDDGVEAEEEFVEEDEEDEESVMYVRKAFLDTIKEKLDKKEEITDEDLDGLTPHLEELEDDVMMVAVQMAVFGEDVALEPKEAKEKLGKQKVAELFMEARKSVLDIPDAERPEDLSAKQLREVMEMDAEGEFPDEYDDEEGEYVEIVDDGEEEEVAEEDGDAEAEPSEDAADAEAKENGEPPEKKQKTEEA